MADDSKTPVETVTSYVEARGGRAAFRNTMLNRRIIDFIKSVSKIS